MFGTPFIWPDPLFAFSVSDGKITVKSDRPIPTGGGTRLLHDCEMLLDRSPLKANGRQYDIYVTDIARDSACSSWPIRMLAAWLPEAFAECF